MLTGPGIVAERQAGRLVIEPFDPAHVNPNSYDVRLAPELLVYERRELRVGEDNPTYKVVIPPEGYRLLPVTVYLASTVEWTETHAPWTPMLNGKSSLGRLGVMVHATAGFGDVGFKGKWTLELHVVQPVIIMPGIRIAQICYFRTEGREQTYAGRYQDQQGAAPYRPEPVVSNPD